MMFVFRFIGLGILAVVIGLVSANIQLGSIDMRTGIFINLIAFVALLVGIVDFIERIDDK